LHVGCVASGVCVRIVRDVVALRVCCWIPCVGTQTICEEVVRVGRPRLYCGSVPFVIYRAQAANTRMVTAYVETVG